MSASNSNSFRCSICRDEYSDDNNSSSNIINLCTDKCHEGLCIQCAKDYISHKILSSKLGHMPLMYCPSVHKDNKRRVLNYNEYSKFIQPELLNILEKNSKYTTHNCSYHHRHH